MLHAAPVVVGRRVHHFSDPDLLVAGEYGHWRDQWVGVTPNGHLVDLSDPYRVELHVDGSITVNPVIEVLEGDEIVWRGRLLYGAWHTEPTGRTP